MNNQPTLNFARTLRPQRFSDIIGQELFVGMLQNTLFLNKFFPVYLFSGQRGCGKTTTARVFAAALNCLNRGKLPLAEIPCLTCASCLANKSGNHPDFIEIDAASNTGVDNVRTILESSTYLPILGKYKIYLIDEAHMLSKAAFNAFLKMMEEPPQSVLFMLATTESYKIPETIRSRCFQLLFKAIPSATLSAYLKSIATKNNFAITDGALDVLIEQTDGSARDALNLLEQLSMFEKEISEETLASFFGTLAHRDVMTIIEKVITHNTAEVIALVQTIKASMRMPQQSWMLFTGAFKAILYSHYGVTSTAFSSVWLDHMKEKSTPQQITELLAILWREEEIFLKTEYKIEFLEHTLVTLAMHTAKKSLSNYEESPKVFRETERQLTQAPHKNITPQKVEIRAPQPTAPEIKKALHEPLQPPTTENPIKTLENPLWQAFLDSVETLTDRLLVSLLKQASFVSYDETSKILTLGLANNSGFFKEKIIETLKIWLPLAANHFLGAEHVDFVGISPQAKPLAIRPTPQPYNQPPQNIAQKSQITSRNANPDQEIRSNPAEWPQAHLLLASFPGKIEEIRNS